MRHKRILTCYGAVTIATIAGKLAVVEFGEPTITREYLQHLEYDSREAEQDIIDAVVRSIDNLKPYEKELSLIGTSFQLQVWNALRKIKIGDTVSYKSIATMIGSPKAYRAVGTACGQNPIAIIIPCHRVIKSNGTQGEYRWGKDLKKKLIDREFSSLPISEQICSIEDKKVFKMLDLAAKAANKTI